MGKDWNKSDKTYFRTTSYNPTVAPERTNSPAHSQTSSHAYNRAQNLNEGSLGVFAMAGIIIGSLLGALIIVGGVWNIVKLNRGSKGGEDESSAGDSSDSDSMDLDLANTDLESRMGDAERPASRARSFRYVESDQDTDDDRGDQLQEQEAESHVSADSEDLEPQPPRVTPRGGGRESCVKLSGERRRVVLNFYMLCNVMKVNQEKHQYLDINA